MADQLPHIVRIERTIDQPRDAVWAVLADFPNISEWNGGVAASHATSDATAGVGARRHCDLAPIGGLEETVLEWDEGSKMVISIDSASKLPIKQGRMTFELADAEPASTAFVLNYEYRANGGPLSGLIGKVLHRQLDKGFHGFLDDLVAAATPTAV